MTVHDDLATLRDLSERMALALIDLGDTGVHDEHAELCDISRRVEAEVARLERERPWPSASTEVQFCLHERKCLELQAAEAEVARLRDGLRRIAEKGSAPWDKEPWSPRKIARALLADQDGAAHPSFDNCPDEDWGAA